MTFAPMDPDVDPEEGNVIVDVDTAGGCSATTSESDGSDVDSIEDDAKAKARNKSLAKLQSTSGGSSGVDNKASKENQDKKSSKKVCSAQATIKRHREANDPDAVIVLKEERVFLRPAALYTWF